MKLQKITFFFTVLFQSLFSIAKIALFSNWFPGFKKIRTDGSECVILGNGPCLNKDFELNLDFIKSKKKLCINFFALSKEYDLIQPDFYVLSEPEYWLNNPAGWFKEKRALLIECLVSKTTWPMKLLIPFAANNSELCNMIMSKKNIEITFYNNTPIEGFTSIINYLFKMNLGMPRPHNVLAPSIILAINLGFKKIIIFGADHSFHEEIIVDESNRITLNSEHFYDNKEARVPVNKLDGKQYFIHDVFRKLYLAFSGYFILKGYADYMNAAVLNASSKSYIDAFEKIHITN
jgi:hypothetical protein